jgi:hypothetical protein
VLLQIHFKITIGGYRYCWIVAGIGSRFAGNMMHKFASGEGAVVVNKLVG